MASKEPEMTNIKGIVTHIIRPGKHSIYVLPHEENFKNHTYVVVRSILAPKRFLPRLLFMLRNWKRRHNYYYQIVTDAPHFVVGQQVDMRVEEYYAPTNLWIQRTEEWE